MAIDQLWLYNEALRLVGERRLVALTEQREPRYLLDDVYDDVFFNTVLEAGQWLFATRSSKFDYSPSVEPPFGYRYAFNKPTDWVRTTAMCSDEYYRVPLNEMADEAGFWFSDLQTIYAKYVSNDAQYGKNLALWPPSFSMFAACHLARRIVPRIKNSKTSTDDIEAEMEKRLLTANSKDAMNGPTKFPPPGSFTSARIGRTNARRSLWSGGGYVGG